MNIIVAIFLILHGLVHAILAMVPRPDSDEPVFATFFSESWLGFSERIAKPLALLLAAIATFGFVAAGLGLLDILVPFEWWRTLAAASAVVSLLLLVLFWHRYVIAGAVIDVVILVVAVFSKWSP